MTNKHSCGGGMNSKGIKRRSIRRRHEMRQKSQTAIFISNGILGDAEHTASTHYVTRAEAISLWLNDNKSNLFVCAGAHVRRSRPARKTSRIGFSPPPFSLSESKMEIANDFVRLKFFFVCPLCGAAPAYRMHHRPIKAGAKRFSVRWLGTCRRRYC